MCRSLPHLMVIVLCIATAAVAPAETVMLPMSDGTRLATDVHLPTSGGPRFPVVLVRTVYGRASDNFGKQVAARGMAAVMQDTRGYGDSEGQKMAFDADGWGKLRDGQQTVAWVKAQPWCNGKIGTWGVSALGITQNLLAPTTGDIRAQVIGLAPADLFGTFVRGGVPQKMLSERYAKRMGHETAFQERRKHTTYDEYWQLGDPGSRVSDITAPAVHVGGWFDLYPQGMIDNFVSRQYIGGPGARGNQKLIIGPWEHGITETVGDLKFPDYQFNWTGYAWRFMDHWLKGADSGMMTEPPVQYYVLGDCSDSNSPGNEWRTASAWPPFSTAATELYLSADGKLNPQPSTAADAKRTYTFDPANPCPSLGGDTAIKPLPLDQRPISSRPDVLVFATEPLTAPQEVTGAVTVKLYVSSDAPDTDFTAKLVDVYPDGREIAIASGIQRVKFRGGFETANPLPPGTVGELTIDCWSTSIIFNKGHKIALHVSSSNWPRYEVNPNTGQNLPKYTGTNEQGDWLIDPTSLHVAQNTVFMDRARPSALILPVRKDTTDAKPSSNHKRGAQVTTASNRARPRQPRIETVRKDAWTPAQRELLEPLEKSGRLYNIFQTLANHPTLQKEWMTFATYILRNSTLSPRDREILILRIGWLCRAEYEWAQHVKIGKRAGLTDDEIRQIQQGPAASGWNDHDRLLLKATDELHADACISDATWQALAKTYDTRQMMDVVFTVGQYNLVSMALNSFGVQLDEGLEGFEK